VGSVDNPESSLECYTAQANFDEHGDVQAGSPDGPLLVRSIAPSLVSTQAADRCHDGIENREYMDGLDVGLAQPVSHVVHNSSRIQHDLELWHRIKKYDAKAVDFSFIPPLFLLFSFFSFL